MLPDELTKRVRIKGFYGFLLQLQQVLPHIQWRIAQSTDHYTFKFEEELHAKWSKLKIFAAERRTH